MATSFTDRMVGAARLDTRIYEEVEADASATGQAMAVVVLASLAAGIGSLGVLGVSGLIWSTVAALAGWFIWAALTFVIGTKLLPEPQTRSDVGELLRTIGFASTPGVLRILGIVPVFGWMISLAAWLWMLVATVIAVRQALDYQSTGRAVGVCVIGFFVNLIVSEIAKFFVGGASLLGGLF